MSEAIVVHIGSFLKCPPAISVIYGLAELGCKTTLVTTTDATREEYIEALPDDVEIKFIDISYASIKNPVKKLCNLRTLREQLWDAVEDAYGPQSFIWVISDVSVKALGNKLLSFKYVLHLLELQEEIRYYRKAPFPRMNAEALGERALAVATAEKNRSYITQAWWGLERPPFVLHNKLYLGGPSKELDESSLDTSSLEQRIGRRKLILYQGVINPKERPLMPYLEAIRLLGSKDYVFGIMAPRDPFEGTISDESYIYIPYINPPNHLMVTQLAYIGVLTYFPVNDHRYSPLNQVYCAPNKVFEFSKYSIPMIGNDIPGLRDVIDAFGCGSIITTFTPEVIAENISLVANNYALMSEASGAFYSSVDYTHELSRVLRSVETKL